MVQTRQTLTDNSPLRWCAQGKQGGGHLVLEIHVPQVLGGFEHLIGQLSSVGVLCALYYDESCGHRQTDRQTDRHVGETGPLYNNNTKHTVSLSPCVSLPACVCLTLESPADTYRVAVAVSVCRCLQVQAEDALCVHVVRQQHALTAGDVRATLPERRPVTSQLLNFFRLRETDRDRQRDRQVFITPDLRCKLRRGPSDAEVTLNHANSQGILLNGVFLSGFVDICSGGTSEKKTSWRRPSRLMSSELTQLWLLEEVRFMVVNFSDSFNSLSGKELYMVTSMDIQNGVAMQHKWLDWTLIHVIFVIYVIYCVKYINIIIFVIYVVLVHRYVCVINVP